MEKTEKKALWSWALYDWANSAYATTVMAGFFPLFFKQYWSHGTDSIVTTARLGTAISVSSLVVAMLSPTLGVIADMKGFKKTFCFLFTVIGVAATAALGFLPLGDWTTAIFFYGLSMMAFNASSVFYDSLMPFVAKGRDMDYASSLGYSMGYLGGGLLFLLNVLMYLNPQTFGFADGPAAIKASFVTAAVWWMTFSIPLFRNVTEPFTYVSKDNVWMLTKKSLRTLRKTFAELIKTKNLFYFIVAYWFFIDGVYTVMTMAVDYGASLNLEASSLITALLITQFIGFPFAYAFGIVAKRWNCRVPLLICITTYAVTVVLATKMTTALHFYLLATVIGMVQGGVQSLSRSMFGRMIRPEQSGEYFGLFNLVGRFASILGPLVVAVGVTVTGDHRKGMLGLLILFLIGGGLLYLVKEPETEEGA